MASRYFGTPPLNSTSLKRALDAAPERQDQGQVRAEREVFCFEIGSMRMGVQSENVREVLRAGAVTPLPRMPGFIVGVTAHRGEVLPVMDLYRFLGRGESRLSGRHRLFVATARTFMAAIIA